MEREWLFPLPNVGTCLGSLLYCLSNPHPTHGMTVTIKYKKLAIMLEFL